jgi:hypothetical protein
VTETVEERTDGEFGLKRGWLRRFLSKCRLACTAGLIESQSPETAAKLSAPFPAIDAGFAINKNCEDFSCTKSKSFEPGCRNWTRFVVSFKMATVAPRLAQPKTMKISLPESEYQC